MGLFNADPEKARAKLLRLLDDARSVLETSRKKEQELADEGADRATLRAATETVKADEAELVTRIKGLQNKDAEIATLKAERAKQLDTETRQKTGDECEAALRNAAAIGKRFDDVMRELAEYSAWAAPFIPEAAGLAGYCKASREQIPEALTLIGKLVGNHAANVLGGSAPATLRKPDVVIAPTVAPSAPTVHLFAMRPVRWVDATGNLIVAQKFSDAYLTPNAAMRALASKACVQINDPLRRTHHGTVGGSADPLLALDLDADPERLADPVMRSPSSPQLPPRFQVTVGEPRQLKVAR